jgi:hypothetical protein
MAAKRVHILKPGQKPEQAKPSPFTGIELVMPAGLENPPIFRIARPDDSVPEGADGNWSQFEPGDEMAPSVEPPAADAKSEADPSIAPNTQDPTPTDRKTQRISFPPGSYVVHFSLPVPVENITDFAVPILWSQPVSIHKGRASRIEVEVPSVPPSALAHVTFKPDPSLYPFNAFSLDLVSTPLKGNRLAAHWDYFIPPSGWPEGVPVTLIPGRYRVVLAASSFGAFSVLRYEAPEPITITATGEIPLKAPSFSRLDAEITDRKGKPLIGLPLIFQGPGQTMVMADTRGGAVSVRLPVGHYRVKAMVWDDREGQKEVTLERNLNMASDQKKKWEAPTTAIDFGFSKLQKPAAKDVK